MPLILITVLTFHTRAQPLPIVGMSAHGAPGMQFPYHPQPHAANPLRGPYNSQPWGNRAPDQEIVTSQQHTNPPQQNRQDTSNQWQKVQGKNRHSRFSGNQQHQQQGGYQNNPPGLYGSQQQQQQQQQSRKQQQQRQQSNNAQPNRSTGSDGPPKRNPEVTKDLLITLKAVFEGSEKIIQAVLDTNPTQTDINTLSELILG